jgi:valyl-tRNA synthetase
MPDKWILSRLAKTIGLINNYLSGFRFSTAAKAAYDFTWNDFCSNYLEMIKPRFAPKEGGEPVSAESIAAARETAGYVLIQILKLLHPFMPYITENIWELIVEGGNEVAIATEKWPEPPLNFIDDELENNMELVIKLALAVRTACAELDVPPSKKPNVMIKCEDKRLADIINNHREQIRNLAHSGGVEASVTMVKPPLSASAVIPGAEIYIPLEGLIDIEQERARLEKELEQKRVYLDKLAKKLRNADFAQRAPAEVIEAEKEKITRTEELIEKLNKNLESLTGW